MSGKGATRPYLAALFWPDMPEKRALMNLRKVLQRLKPFHSYLLINLVEKIFSREGLAYPQADPDSALKLSNYITDFVQPVALAGALEPDAGVIG